MHDESLGSLGDPEYKECSQHIVDSGRHLLSLINDVLDMSRIESGKMALQEESIQLAGLIRPCLAMMGARVEQQNLTLRQSITEDLPILDADPLKLKQIVINLLSNAIKFTPAGGSITIEAAYRPEEGFALRVIDNGIGMTAEEQAKALDRFCQVEGALNRQQGGTGLGLPLTKALVELHGGSLEIDSAPKVGTTVTVHLPASRAHHLDADIEDFEPRLAAAS